MNSIQPDLTDLDSLSLSRYITERLTLNNYAEARRACVQLMIRLAPDNPPSMPLAARVADAIVSAHLEGQRTGEARYEEPLRHLVKVVVGMDLDHQDERPEEHEYQHAVIRAAAAVGVEIPSALRETWRRNGR